MRTVWGGAVAVHAVAVGAERLRDRTLLSFNRSVDPVAVDDVNAASAGGLIGAFVLRQAGFNGRGFRTAFVASVPAADHAVNKVHPFGAIRAVNLCH